MARFSLNNCTFSGNLGGDPKVRTANDTKVATFSLAISRGDDTSWANVVCFGKTADKVEQYLKKGSRIIAVCRYQARPYEVDGEKRTSYEFIADQIIFDGDPKTENNTTNTTTSTSTPTPINSKKTSTTARKTAPAKGQTLTEELEEDTDDNWI